jgi:hypothetical protein
MSRSSTFCSWGIWLVLEIGRDEQLEADFQKSGRLSHPHRGDRGLERDRLVDAPTHPPLAHLQTNTPMISWLARGVGLF